MPIPRIFHQIWVGPDPLPEEHAQYGETWRQHHPGWELRLWRDDNLEEGFLRPEVYDLRRSPYERADILRLEVVYRYGGVHVDTDFECLRALDPLIEDVEFFIGYRKPGVVNGALFGATKEHPLLRHGLDVIRPVADFGYDKDATGPKFVDDLVLGRPEVTFFDPPFFYPRTPDDFDVAYAVHHKARGWKDEEGLRRSLRKAEQRLFEAQKEAREWRRKYEQAEAELDRLRTGSG